LSQAALQDKLIFDLVDEKNTGMIQRLFAVVMEYMLHCTQHIVCCFGFVTFFVGQMNCTLIPAGEH